MMRARISSRINHVILCTRLELGIMPTFHKWLKLLYPKFLLPLTPFPTHGSRGCNIIPPAHVKIRNLLQKMPHVPKPNEESRLKRENLKQNFEK